MTEKILRRLNPLEGVEHWWNWLMVAAVVIFVLLLIVGAASGFLQGRSPL